MFIYGRSLLDWVERRWYDVMWCDVMSLPSELSMNQIHDLLYSNYMISRSKWRFDGVWDWGMEWWFICGLHQLGGQQSRWLGWRWELCPDVHVLWWLEWCRLLGDGMFILYLLQYVDLKRLVMSLSSELSTLQRPSFSCHRPRWVDVGECQHRMQYELSI